MNILVKLSSNCQHNPLKKNSFARLFGFLFLRNKFLNDFDCDGCGCKLMIPRCYASVPMQVGCYFVSMIGSYAAMYSAKFGGLLSRIPAFFNALIIILGIHIFVKLLSSLALTYGRWEQSDNENNAEKQQHLLEQGNTHLNAASMLGLVFSGIYFSGIGMVCYLLIISVGIIISSIIKKRWKYIAIGLVFTAYSMIKLLHCGGDIPKNDVVDGILTLTSMVWFFFVST